MSYDPTHDDKAPELTEDLVLSALIIVGIIGIVAVRLGLLDALLR